ncbi:MAG: leucine-rich repeat domain-containing protein, partial [Lachnospiraceae bacterium]|nr:leucine-rich repeat domain-containing protein [Lachnospiraceae bacterium]
NYTCVDGVIYGKSDESLVAWPARRAGAVTLGSNVRKIYDYAFSGARITSIAMEGDVEYIGEEAFAKSMVTQVTLPSLHTAKEVSAIMPELPIPKQWSSSAFNGCSRLVKVVFPEKSILTNNIAFINCTSLKEVVLPDTMMELSDKMFFGCTSLESITLPKNITNIPQGCFYNCRRLKNINLENIGQIGVAAFSHCSSLAGTLTLNAEKIGALSFEKCTGIKEVKFNKPLSKILYDQVTEYNYINLIDDRSSEVLKSLEYVTGGMQSNPFAGCTALTSISVPEGGQVRSIDGVLYSLDMKELIAFPAALTGKFNIPYGVKSICPFAFQDSALTELVTSNSVRYIHYHALNGSRIKSLTISKGVRYLEELALDGCMKLESIKVHASNWKYESEDGVLYEKKARGSLLLYPSARKGKKYTVRKEAGLASYSFNNCKYLKEVVMQEGAARDNDIAFYNCKNIKLYLPESMESYNMYRYSKVFSAFDKTCRGCVMYAKKNSPLAKFFDKNKVRYQTY